MCQYPRITCPTAEPAQTEPRWLDTRERESAHVERKKIRVSIGQSKERPGEVGYLSKGYRLGLQWLPPAQVRD